MISTNSPAALNYCRPLLKQNIGKAPPHAYPSAACDSDCAWQLARLAAPPEKQSRCAAAAFKRQKFYKAATPSSCKRRPASCVNLNTKVDEVRPCELFRHLQPMRCNGLGLGMWHGHPVYVLPLICWTNPVDSKLDGSFSAAVTPSISTWYPEYQNS